MNILEEIESGIRIVSESGPKILYHGSKGGIHGKINPNGRKNCDFGSGFYMGSNKWQTRTLVYGKKDNPWAYDLSIDLTDLKIVELSGIAWALYVVLNRRPEKFAGIGEFGDWMVNVCGDADIVKGSIADDRLVPVMNIFFAETCTVEALLAALSECSLGTQYAAKTELACSRISIVRATRIDRNDRIVEEHARNFSLKGEEAYRRAIEAKMRRTGRYVDELVGEIRDCLVNGISPK